MEITLRHRSSLPSRAAISAAKGEKLISLVVTQGNGGQPFGETVPALVVETAADTAAAAAAAALEAVRGTHPWGAAVAAGAVAASGQGIHP